MTEPDFTPPPFRFSLFRLIIIVNLIGLSTVAIFQFGDRGAAVLALTVSVAAIPSLVFLAMQLGKRPLFWELIILSLRVAFRIAFTMYLFFAVITFLIS